MVDYRRDYQRWLVGASSRGYVIETLQVSHPSFDTVRICNQRTNVRARIETGAERTFQAASFAIEILPKERSTEQRITASLSGLDGKLYEFLKRMSYEDRLTHVEVTHRTYLSTNLNRPVLSPPPVLEVRSLDGTREQVNFDLVPSALPTRYRAGLYYNVAKSSSAEDIPVFPGLVAV